MKSSCIVFLCLLTAAFYFFSPTIISSSSSFIELPAYRMRPSVRKLSMLTPHEKHKYHKVKVSSKFPFNVKVFLFVFRRSFTKRLRTDMLCSHALILIDLVLIFQEKKKTKLTKFPFSFPMPVLLSRKNHLHVL